MAPGEEVAVVVAVAVEAVVTEDQAMGPDQGMVRAVAAEVLLEGMDMVVAAAAVVVRVRELVALGMGPGKDLATELAAVLPVDMGVAEVVEVAVARVVVPDMAMEVVKDTALGLALVVVLPAAAVDMVAVVVVAKVGLAMALVQDMDQVKDTDKVVLMEEAMEAVVAVVAAVVKVVVALAMDLDPAPVMEAATTTDIIRLFLRARYMLYKYVTRHESVLLHGMLAVSIVCVTPQGL
jgi:hypothetical protein|uniref:Uncharacterized protein n=1 Tax=Zea mays TaxID=4577 RepID=A0A804LZ62_MAIZE